MDDYEFYDPPPWALGTIGGLEPWQEMPEEDAAATLKALAKKMKFIGFYENEEKTDAVHEGRKTRLQKRK